jgi:hypothetical protein
MISLDQLTESAGRWLAARTTRRSFLGNVGRVSLVAAGGSLLSATFAGRAEARVCGQSGVSPKCPTFDCFAPSVWGWCWYAGDASCCAGGGLKKICDCCRAAHPNVHGYCPDGANVYCVVESCLEDPRLMKVSVDRYPGATPAEVAFQRTAVLAAGSVGTVVLADSENPFAAAMALPVAAAVSATVLTSPQGELPPAVAAEIVRLGAKRVIVIGPGFSSGVITALNTIAGLEVGHIGTNPSIPGASIEVARWVFSATGSKTFMCISDSGPSSVTALTSGSFAALARVPLVISQGAADALRSEIPALTVTWIGDEVVAGKVGTDISIAGSDPLLVARAILEARLTSETAAVFPLAFYPTDLPAAAVGLVQPGSLAVPHVSDQLDVATRDWLMARRGRFVSAQITTGFRPSFQERRIWELQSAMNGFEQQLLIGDDGMGIPVIPQPVPEREMGKARVSGPTTSTIPGPVVARAKPKKRTIAQTKK